MLQKEEEREVQSKNHKPKRLSGSGNINRLIEK